MHQWNLLSSTIYVLAVACVQSITWVNEWAWSADFCCPFGTYRVSCFASVEDYANFTAVVNGAHETFGCLWGTANWGQIRMTHLQDAAACHKPEQLSRRSS